ncbi:type 1 glutamine amidotransferase [Cobetia sp. L2A1]|uniref:type 1 glutamine amidotransferase n=1 Tax=Cobetia sp. L2A1 TaxID=2686360 RepID=UPI00131A641F|nr:type 1 glutamine amidotransferase [Cobetia sp. L2A1]
MHLYFIHQGKIPARPDTSSAGIQTTPHGWQDPVRLSDWLTGMGHSHNSSFPMDGEALPGIDDFEALVILDGPQRLSLSEEAQPEAIRQALRLQRKLVRRALNSNRPVLGIGLGARLIAEQLGAIVSPAVVPQRCWVSLERSDKCPLNLPAEFEALVWHEEICGLPEDCELLASGERTPVAGFCWDERRVIALNFHPNLDAAATSSRLEEHPAPTQGHGVQSGEELLTQPRRFDRQAALLDRLMLEWLRH